MNGTTQPDAAPGADVIVVGAGPVGLATALQLGQRGHQVLVLERWPSPYARPRAVSFDGETGRLLQRLGLADAVRAISEPVLDHYEWRSAGGDLLVDFDWSQPGPSGWPVASFFHQPDLETVLESAVAATPTIAVRRGATVTGLRQGPAGVSVSWVEGGTLTQAQADYVVGADGASSTVARLGGFEFDDLGFQFDWLIIDVTPLDGATWSPSNLQLCDPARPTTVVSGGPGRRRWEFMVMPGEDPAQMNSEQVAWRLLEPWGRTPENSELERHAVYSFQARWAKQWRRGRVILTGDAAHLMPPFAGQGLCSGLRDAANLGWKLDLVLRGAARAELLDTYTSERREHVRGAIDLSVALGRVICLLDPDEARARDTRMAALDARPEHVLDGVGEARLGPGAHLGQGVALDGGRLTDQSLLSDGRLLDDAVQALAGDSASGFVLLANGFDPYDHLDVDERELMTGLGVRVVRTDNGPLLGPGLSVAAIEHPHRIEAILVRPDCYAFGRTSDPGRLGDLIRSLSAHLHLTTPTIAGAHT